MDKTKYNEIRAVLSETPCINEGGCLWAAYAVYLLLKKEKQLPEKFAIVGFDDGDDGDEYYITNKEFLKGNTTKTMAMDHFGWTFGRTVYDSTKKVEEKYKYKIRIKGETIEAFCRNALSSCTWNPSFDVKRIKEIGKKFEIDFGV